MESRSFHRLYRVTVVVSDIIVVAAGLERWPNSEVLPGMPRAICCGVWRFASHDTKSDALEKYDSDEEVVMEGAVKSKEGLDALAERFAEDGELECSDLDQRQYPVRQQRRKVRPCASEWPF
jgi:hypothetical protein